MGMQEGKVSCAVYTRVSTDGQAEVEFNSCESQEIKIRSFIASQENMEIYKSYSDPGYTGANLDRPAFNEMINDIQAGRINVVISYKIDRLTRSPKDFYQLIEVLDKYNVSFISVTERFDTSTPSGRLLRNIMLTFAQFERELISERIRDKMLERAKKGYWNIGSTPFGYKREAKKLVINPDEATVVKYIFENYVSTGSTYELYKQLKENCWFNRKGLPFTVEDLSKLIRRVVYIGKVEYKGNIYQGIHQPIISEELFNAAQNVERKKIKRKIVQNNHFFPGMVQCKECGSTMTTSFASKGKIGRKRRYFYYRCTSVTKRDISFCGTRYVSSNRLDSYIIQNLRNMLNSEIYLKSLLPTLSLPQHGNLTGVEQSRGNINIELNRVKETIKNVVAAAGLESKTEREIIFKRHIKNILYSKDAIEVNLLYAANDKELPPIAPLKNENGAACCRVAAATSRPAHPQPKNRPFSEVCNQQMVGDLPIRQTRTVVLPNLIHGSKTSI
jgi:site-specific DNA recombinase